MKNFLFTYADSIEDYAIVQKFVIQAKILEKKGKIKLWHQKDSLASDDISKEETEKKFKEADVIVLFTSANYLSSEKSASEIIWALNNYYNKSSFIFKVKISPVFDFDEGTNFIKLPEKDNLLEYPDIDAICFKAFAEICIISGVIEETVHNISEITISNPKGLRLFLDTYFPLIHNFLTRKTNLFSEPTKEIYDITTYNTNLKEKIKKELSLKTYIHLSGKEMHSSDASNECNSDLFTSSIQREIRYIYGKAKGGDEESAIIAAKSKKNKLVRNIKSFILRRDEPMILLGDPGTGKTMTIQEGILSILHHEKNKIFPLIPIYVRLGEFNIKTSNLSEVKDFVYRNSEKEIKPYLNSLLKSNKRVIIFFDGMDEMSRENYIEKIKLLGKFAEVHKNFCKCLFSCRINDFSSAFEYHRLVILPLETFQIKKFLKVNKIKFPLSINNEELDINKTVKKLSSGDLPMEANNPFILWLFCNFIQKQNRWPNSRVELIKSYIEEIYHIKASKIDLTFSKLPESPKALFNDWGYFAFILMEENVGTSLPTTLLFDKFESNEIVYRLISAGKICNVIRESLDGEEHLLKFEHQRFQEYFSAYYIHTNNISIDWLNKIDSPRWQETLLNYILISNDEHSIKLFEQSINEDLEDFARYIDDRKKIESESYLEKQLRLENERLDITVPSFNHSNYQKEALLTDKIELGSRLVKQLGQESELKDIIVPTLNKSIYYVAEHGNPISQGKILFSSQNMIKEIDRHLVCDHTIKSNISWVKSQAIVLSTRNISGNDNISNYNLEIGLNIINGKIFKNFKSFYKAAKESGLAKLKLSLIIGLIVYLAKLSVIVAANYSLFYLCNNFLAPKYVWLFIDYNWAYVAFLTLSCLYVYWKEPENLWIFSFGINFAIHILSFLILAATKFELEFAIMIGFAFFIYMLYQSLAIIGFILRIIENILIYIFVACTAKKGFIKNNFLRLSGSISETYNTDLKFDIGLANFFGIVLWIGIMLLMGYLGSYFNVVNWFSSLGDTLLSPFTPIIEYFNFPTGTILIICLYAVSLSLLLTVIFLVHFLFTRKEDLLLIGLGCLGVSVFALILIKIFSWISELIFSYLSFDSALFQKIVNWAIILLIFILLTFVFVKCMSFISRFLKYLFSVNMPKYPQNLYTPSVWIEMIKKSDALRQDEILQRTEFYSLGLESNKEFVSILIEVQDYIKKENPALEKYWSKRKKLEEDIKLERN